MMMMDGDAHQQQQQWVYSSHLSDNVAHELARHRSKHLEQPVSVELEESTAYFQPHADWPSQQEWDGPRLCLVVDTNVFLTGLSFLEQFLTASNGLAFLGMIGLPLTVVEELDFLKDAHRLCCDENGNEVPISQLARRAIRWIQSMFHAHPHHIIGQRMADVHVRSPVLPVVKQNDDRILHFALAMHFGLLPRLRPLMMKVLLVSHDRALCVKASMNGLAACSHRDLPAEEVAAQDIFDGLSWTQTMEQEGVVASTSLGMTEPETDEFTPRSVGVLMGGSDSSTAPAGEADDDAVAGDCGSGVEGEDMMETGVDKADICICSAHPLPHYKHETGESVRLLQ